ncbi:uncharacterized protein LODBEIA_P29910 [Lodderomyces beijingensis]|uniref:Nuclear polyadenylated RNA-binding protein NAB2 n=1 Tax=Lodderomyces beijingensis TaxID=1775926 RepID=A0ABP0ZN15_9ASCO
MKIELSPEVDAELRFNLIKEINRLYGKPEGEAADIAEYLIYCITEGKKHEDIVQEVQEIAGIPIDSHFINEIYVEIDKISNQRNPPAAAAAAAAPASAFPQARSEMEGTGRDTVSDAFHRDSSSNTTVGAGGAAAPNSTTVVNDRSSYAPTAPKQLTDEEKLSLRRKRFGDSATGPSRASTTARSSMSASAGRSIDNRVSKLPPHSSSSFSSSSFSSSSGASSRPSGPSSGHAPPRASAGISKTRTSDRNHAPRAPQITQRLENFVKGGQQDSGVSRIVAAKRTGRCPDAPNCKNRECENYHPTKECFAFPNCNNPPGTCKYLHPGEDDELMKKLQERQKEYEKNKLNYLAVQQGACKFGPTCAKDNCPYAHPTPANPQARIRTLEWCSAGKDCVDETCDKSHPRSPNVEAKNIPSAASLALEQCKFGMQCTNARCPRRHATSAVQCRNGALCTRPDCTFAHPINEECRFGVNCTAQFCLFQHPPERQIQSSTWTSGPSNQATVTNRQFAVGDDQVVEQIVQQ